MKRTGLFLAGITALLPALSLESPALAERTGSHEFQPPTSDLVLTRTVSRSLGDGQEIVTRRRYSIRFVRHGDGYQLFGELIEATVDAPPILASLAELERKRPDLGMFPITIDRKGRIVSTGPKPPLASQDRNQLGMAVRSIVGKTALDPQDKRQIQEQVSRIMASAAASSSGPPPELFDPSASPRREQRVLALPDGGEGRVEVAVNVERASRQSLARSVERTVITELEGSRRISREVWAFTPPN